MRHLLDDNNHTLLVGRQKGHVASTIFQQTRSTADAKISPPGLDELRGVCCNNKHRR